MGFHCFINILEEEFSYNRVIIVGSRCIDLYDSFSNSNCFNSEDSDLQLKVATVSFVFGIGVLKFVKMGYLRIVINKIISTPQHEKNTTVE